MEKGEIARYEQFHLFPQCFQKTSAADTLKPGLVWERVNQSLEFACTFKVSYLCTIFQSKGAFFFLLSGSANIYSESTEICK